MDSSWELSFPGAVKAIAQKQSENRQLRLLQHLEDVEISIRYSARE